jgi:hypothetical protein
MNVTRTVGLYVLVDVSFRIRRHDQRGLAVVLLGSLLSLSNNSQALENVYLRSGLCPYHSCKQALTLWRHIHNPLSNLFLSSLSRRRAGPCQVAKSCHLPFTLADP